MVADSSVWSAWGMMPVLYSSTSFFLFSSCASRSEMPKSDAVLQAVQLLRRHPDFRFIFHDRRMSPRPLQRKVDADPDGVHVVLAPPHHRVALHVLRKDVEVRIEFPVRQLQARFPLTYQGRKAFDHGAVFIGRLEQFFPGKADRLDVEVGDFTDWCFRRPVKKGIEIGLGGFPLLLQGYPHVEKHWSVPTAP